MTQEAPGNRRSTDTSEPRRHELADLYELLEVSPRASQEVIQAAYRVLARSYHPDLNARPEAANRIRQLNAAYEVLSDSEGRARYDLEYSRAHRFERLVERGHGGVLPRAAAASHGGALPPRGRLSQQRPVDERFTLRQGAAMLGLVVITVVAALLIVLLANAMDAPMDSSPFDNTANHSVQFR